MSRNRTTSSSHQAASKHNLPLTGFRVLEVAHYAQGPLAGQILADLGAEVIKVENPEGGDHLRGVRRIFGRSLDLGDNKMLLFEGSNRNKKSITLDLKNPKAREVIYRLAQKCDVFLTNFTPKARRRFGFEEEIIRRYNPDVIYGQGTIFGSKGPDGEASGQDTTGTARSGLMMSIAKGDEPLYPPHAMSDLLSGTMLAFGIVVALLGRDKPGVAKYVEASQLSSLIWLQRFGIELYANKGEEFLKFDRTDGPNPLMNVYRCRDGNWIAIGLARGIRDWPDFCQIMGIGGYVDDPRFATAEARFDNSAALIAILDKIFPTRPREDWERAFQERGIWCSVVNTIPDLLKDPQVIANEYVASFEGGLKQVTLPFQISGAPLKGKSPELGVDTTEVLVDIGGFDWEEVAAFVSEGLV